MQLSEFLTEFQDLLQRDDPIDPTARLKDLEEWDSMSIMACMVWLDKKFSLRYPFITIAKLETVPELVALTKGNVA